MSCGPGLNVVLAVALGMFVGQETKPADKPFDDAEFVKMAASSGMHEVMIAKIAIEKAKKDDVKKFAEKMLADHTKANDQLKEAAKEAGIAVPEKISDEHQKHVDMFMDYKGSNFDLDYIKHTVKDHEASVALFTKASKEAKNKGLSDLATKLLPTIQAHLDHAKKLQKD